MAAVCACVPPTLGGKRRAMQGTTPPNVHHRHIQSARSPQLWISLAGRNAHTHRVHHKEGPLPCTRCCPVPRHERVLARGTQQTPYPVWPTHAHGPPSRHTRAQCPVAPLSSQSSSASLNTPPLDVRQGGRAWHATPGASEEAGYAGWLDVKPWELEQG